MLQTPRSAGGLELEIELRLGRPAPYTARRLAHRAPWPGNPKIILEGPGILFIDMETLAKVPLTMLQTPRSAGGLELEIELRLDRPAPCTAWHFGP